MGIKQEVKAALKDVFVTKINRQPCNDNLNQLEQELCAVAASIPTIYGGGMHDHIEIIVKSTEYVRFSYGSVQFVILQILGHIQ